METHSKHPWAGSCQEPVALSGASGPQLKSAQVSSRISMNFLASNSVKGSSFLPQAMRSNLESLFSLETARLDGVEVAAHDSHV